MGGLFSEVIHYICGAAIPLFIMTTGCLLLNRDSYDTKYAFRKILSTVKVIILWSFLLCVVKMVTSQSFVNPFYYAIAALTQQGVLAHFWYLWMLVLLYACGLFFHYINKASGKNGGGSKAVLLTLLSLCLIASFDTLLHGANGVEYKTPQALRLWVSLAYLCCGNTVYQIKGLTQKNGIKVSNSFLIGICLILWIANAFTQYKVLNEIVKIHSPEYLFSNPIVIIINCFIFLCFCLLNVGEFFQKAILYLSKISFGVFILHMFFLIAIDRFIPGIAWYMKWIMTTFASFCTSAIVNRIPVVKEWFVL